MSEPSEEICPRCGVNKIGWPALSRYDNETDICTSCGTEEGMAALTGQPFGREQWADRRPTHRYEMTIGVVVKYNVDGSFAGLGGVTNSGLTSEGEEGPWDTLDESWLSDVGISMDAESRIRTVLDLLAKAAKIGGSVTDD